MTICVVKEKWETASLGDLIEINPDSIGRDYQFSEIEYVDISSVGTGTLEGTTKLNLKRAPSRAKRLVKDGDTILSTVRPNRRSFLLIQNPCPNLVVSTGFAVLRVAERINQRFLYFLISNQAFTDYLAVNAKGAAYPAIDTDTISRAEIKLPHKKVQCKISSILSAYDDLIENNTRRIKILEGMARLIYREWFVHFRFPGHEKVKMANWPLGKIPEEWSCESLEALCVKITDGSHWSPRTTEVGFPMASVKDMHNWGVNVSTCRKISHKDFDELVKNNCRPMKGDVLIAKDGSYLKHVFVVRDESDIVILSSIAILRPNDKLSSDFLALTLQSPEVKGRLKGCVSGVALPRIILKDFRQFEIVVPPKELQDKFCQIVTPIADLCHKLVQKNANLHHCRDMLLPKLISGELDVSGIDIPTGDDAS